MIARISRRSFLQGLGLGAAGLSLGLFPAHAEADEPTTEPGATGKQLSAFIHVAPDGLVTIACHRSEMGQGVRSSLPVLIADEMGADIARLRVVQADGDEAWGDQNTDGSSSVRTDFDRLRRIGAAARAMLVGAAAKTWGVAPATCAAKSGLVTHTPTGRTLGFGALADLAARQPVPELKKVTLRPRAELTHLGKPLPLRDGPDLVIGKALFGADIRLPGMLTAVIARCPVVGGKVARYDGAKALAVPGVRRLVVIPAAKRPYAFAPLGGVAVVADNTWAAIRGRAALDVTWDPGDNASYDSGTYKQALRDAVHKPGTVERKRGDFDAALARSHRRIEALYETPHLAHAPMEPPVAVARYASGRCEVWAPTQSPEEAKLEVAKHLAIKPEHVTVHVTLLGGAFGRKAKPDYVVEAALLSREVGAPVRVQWTREDDLQHDYYHSVAAQLLTAGLDEKGNLVAWRHRTAFPPIGSTFGPARRGSAKDLQQGVIDIPLVAPNVRAEACDAPAHVRIGWLRSVANIYHAFAVHSFIDELAHARGVDPRQNILDVSGPPRHVTLAELGVEGLANYGASLEEHPIDTARLHHVVERVTALSRWSERTREKRALGLAAHRSFLTYVAVVVSVVRDASGQLRCDEAWIVADAGTIVNLERVRAQLEGAVIFGLSVGLYGNITMRNGATVQSNFHDHRIVRMKEAPRTIHVEVVKSEGPPGGVGEPGVPPVAPALANAVFALTGTRVRELPIVRSVPA